MNLILPFIFLVFSTLCGAVVAKPLLARLRSAPLIIATSWFTGQYISAFIVYYLSVALVALGQSDVLFKSSLIFPIVATAVIALFFRRPTISRLRSVIEQIRTGGSIGDVVVCCVGFLFAFFFFLSQLRTDGEFIKTALVYWDFPVHAPIIQGFVLGDNFPAQNNSLSGVPLTYHFYSDFLISIYAALGLDLVLGVNAVTTIAFGFLLTSVYGFATEFFYSRTAGGMAMALVVTSGSLRFFYDYLVIWRESFSHWLSSITGHPYYVALLPGNPAGYNGNMFNMFYFLAERQMIFASIFLLLSIVALYHRRSFSVVQLLIIGLAAGAFIHWHLFVSVTVLMMVGCTFLGGSGRKASALMFLAMCSLVGVQALELRELTQSALFFPDVREYPRFNPLFPTMDPFDSATGYPLSFRNFVWYYLFAYGLKFFIIPWGLFRLWKRDRELAVIFLALLVPTFVAINTVQLSPLSVYDNHKWLRPLNVALDIVVAGTIATILVAWSTLTRRVIGVGAILLCTAGGAIELIPYLLPVKGTDREGVYAPRHTPLTNLLEAATPPQAHFLTGGPLEVHLAGRQTFLSNPHDEPGATGMTASFRINEGPRQMVRAKLYNASSRRELCDVAQAHRIDYVEQSELSPTIQAYPPGSAWPFISARNRRGQMISFLDIASLCSGAKAFEERKPTTSGGLASPSVDHMHEAIPLSSLTPTFEKADFAPARLNRSFLDRPIMLAGKSYASGLGLHAPIVLKYAVPADAAYLRGIVGLDDEVFECNGHSILFRIHDEDGNLVFDSGLIVSHLEPKPFAVEIKGKKELALTVADSGDGNECDHVDVADAFFTKSAP